jgi:ATP-dependent DNA ligase
MTAALATALPDSDAWSGGVVYEPRMDGLRALAHVRRGACRLQSWTGQDITADFPEIAAAAAAHVPSGMVLDGELVRAGGRSHSFIIFDALAAAGMDLRPSPFRVRRQALTILLDDAPPPLQVITQTRDRAQASAWLGSHEGGIAGVVAKGLATPYTPHEANWQQVRGHGTLARLRPTGTHRR